ncbi:hypothetical protein CCR79_02465 [Halorhodospira halophila]|nr:hypothetical protein [Halorhodospira halophila]
MVDTVVNGFTYTRKKVSRRNLVKLVGLFEFIDYGYRMLKAYFIARRLHPVYDIVINWLRAPITEAKKII